MDSGRFTLLLLFGIVICCFFGTGITAQNPPPKYVNGILRRSVLFPINIPRGKTVATIKLDFYSLTGKKNHLAEISNGTLECTNACGRLGHRLEMADETTLRIRDLEMEDSGLYNAHVKFTDDEYPKYSFSLTVYTPVPKLQIILLEVSKAPRGFNVTLQCLAAEGVKIDVSWGRGDPSSPWELSPDWHCLSDNGTVLRLFWPSNSSDSTVSCQASNPADQKSVSYDLNSILKTEGADTNWYIIIPVVCGSLFVMLIIFFWKRKALKSIFGKVFSQRNSTPDTTELQHPPSRNGYAECPRSEPGEISDS